MSRSRILAAIAALVLAAVALWHLERPRWPLDITRFEVGDTPATLYARPDADGPVIVLAHGFAGSQQMMQGFALTLARAGYRAVTFDFFGHGRNRKPMVGDTSSVDGATARLVAETERVLAAARERTGATGPAGLLGHSLGADVVVRAAIADPTVAAVVAVSMYSDAVTAERPRRLLLLAGQFEPSLRAQAVDALQKVNPKAGEGETAHADGVVRSVIVAPAVEHVSILDSRTALRSARGWFDDTFGRDASGPVTAPGPWLLVLLGAILLLGWPLSDLLGSPRPIPPLRVNRGRVTLAVLVPAVATPLILSVIDTQILPVLVADYLALHLCLYGLLQLSFLGWAGIRHDWRPLWPGLAMAAYGIGIFGIALDRYGASFVPGFERLWLIGAMAVGTVPFMLADSLLLRERVAPPNQIIMARLGIFASLGLAVLLSPGRLYFLVIVLPVILLFLAIFGLLARWTAARGGPVAAGLGLGLILAWALGVSFPLFAG